MKQALVLSADGLTVINNLSIPDVDTPEQHGGVASPNPLIGIGWKYVGGSWIAPASAVPPSVAMWQAKAALQAAGLLTSATAAVAAANNPVLTAFWEGASTIDRSSPTLAGISAALSLTSAQIDALFVQAATIAL